MADRGTIVFEAAKRMRDSAAEAADDGGWLTASFASQRGAPANGAAR